MPPQVLLSRVVDPLLGVFTGCLAYYLFETNPRTALPADQRLGALLHWKWAKRQRETQGGTSSHRGEKEPSGTAFQSHEDKGTR